MNSDKFLRVEYQDSRIKSLYFRCPNCLWTTIQAIAMLPYPELNATDHQLEEMHNHQCSVTVPTTYQFPEQQDTSAMAKSRDPNSYNPLIRQILMQAIEAGHYESAPMEEKYAHSLRFDLNGYKKALEATGSPDFETLGLASISLRRVPTPPGHAVIEVYPGGPAWTSPDAMAAITAGLDKKSKNSPSFDIPDQAKLDALTQFGTLQSEDEEPLHYNPALFPHG